MANDLIAKLKDQKMVPPVVGALTKFYGPAICVGDTFATVRDTVFPKKDKARHLNCLQLLPS